MASNAHTKALEKRTAILSLDVELRGSSPMRHGLLAIGFCLGHVSTEEIIMSGTIAVAPMMVHGVLQSYEQKCVNEFWSKHRDVQRYLESIAVDCYTAVTAFNSLLMRFEKEYNLCIISDCPVQDFGVINYYLDLFAFNQLQFTRSCVENTNEVVYNYRPLFCTDSFARGVSGMSYDNIYTSDVKILRHFQLDTSDLKRTHFPEDDAKVAYRTHFRLLQKAHELQVTRETHRLS
jgi:hypothetical protein